MVDLRWDSAHEHPNFFNFVYFLGIFWEKEFSMVPFKETDSESIS